MGVVVFFLAVVFYRRSKKRKRKAPTANYVPRYRPETTGHENDLFSGLDSSPTTHDPGPPPSREPPRTPQGPKPGAPEPSYIEEKRAESEPGPTYLDF
jgi:hypothetical protein